MTSYVVDSSAIIALLMDEPGAGKVQSCISSSYISTVNLAEIVTYFVKQDVVMDTIRQSLSVLPFQVIPFDSGEAYFAGELYIRGKPYGLSLGDRCCLALALARSLPVLTGDRVWKNLEFDVPIEVFR